MNVSSRRTARKRPIAEINVVPYIDVMLVLLVIFMITAPLLSEGVKVNLPKTRSEKLAPQDKAPIIISINAKGQYFLNGHSAQVAAMPIDAADLIGKLQLSLAKTGSETQQVLIKGDKDVDYGKVVQLFALLQQAGIGSVGLVTEPVSAV